jgi:hypothetical protein
MFSVLIAAVSNSLSNPYVPKRKLSTCSQWLQSWLKITNTAFDDLAIFLAPYIHVQSQALGRRRSCAGSFSSTSTAFPRRQRARPRNHATAIVFLAVAMGVARAQAYCDNPGPAVAHRALFDSDSFDILVDGGATASIYNCLENFIQPPITTNIRIKGFNGTYSAARIGTIRWPILDNEGDKHVLQIPDTHFVASCPMRLLSPQHYSQQIHDHRGTYSTNFGNQVVFVFHKKKFQVTIPLSPSSNVGILCSAPGHQVFSCFVEDAKPPKEPPPAIFDYNVITDDEANDMELQEETESVSTAEDGEDVILRGDSAVCPPSDLTATSVHPLSESAASRVRPPPAIAAPVGFKGGSEVRPPVNIFPTENVRPSTLPNNSVNPPGTSSEESDEPDRPNIITFDLDNDKEDTNLTDQDDVTSSLDSSAELMRWHIRLGHLLFANIRLMTSRKEIPSQLVNC